MKTLNDVLKAMITKGTPLCGAACALAGAAIAVMLIAIGFWKTLFVALMCLAGAFMGGVKDKRAFVKDRMNRLFPEKKE